MFAADNSSDDAFIHVPPTELAYMATPQYSNGRIVRIGDRVQRGSDWNDQDGGPGNSGLVSSNGIHKTICKMDNGNEYWYRMGEKSAYELQLVQRVKHFDFSIINIIFD